MILVDAAGEERHGNGAGTGEFATRNNVERVIWSKANLGLFQVVVEAVGGFTLLDERQGFAVVCAVLKGSSAMIVVRRPLVKVLSKHIIT